MFRSVRIDFGERGRNIFRGAFQKRADVSKLKEARIHGVALLSGCLAISAAIRHRAQEIHTRYVQRQGRDPARHQDVAILIPDSSLSRSRRFIHRVGARRREDEAALDVRNEGR